MKKYVFAILSALLCCAIFADTGNEKADAYLGKYADMAVAEMYRSGVPASITLAQGMLESGYGQSTLATSANNHFGIKCHSDWKGEHVNADDDEKGECFRKYASVADSYQDHSDFLRYKQRYAFLFDYEVTDYKSWANGLKKAGYATDPTYASKLIAFIENYRLYEYDREKPKLDASVEDSPVDEDAVLPESPNQLESASRFTGSGLKGTFAFSLSREVLQINGVPFIYAREGETYKSIAALYDLFPKELMRFNDRKKDRDLLPGEIVYLQPKNKRAVKGLDKHICTEGETLLSISQKYAVTLSSLMKYNGIGSSDAVLHEDDTIFLRYHRNGKN